MILNQPKYIFIFLLTFLLAIQTTYAKTELILPQKSISFSIEQNQIFKGLEKELQPNIGFLKEKARFVLSESISAQNTCNFSKEYLRYLANAVDDLVRGVSKNVFKASFTASDEIAEQAWTFFKNEDWGSNQR